MKKFNFSKGLVIGLLTLALCLTCFAAVKTSAADAPSAVSATYDAETNKITASGVVYVLKAEKGNTIKAGAASYSVSGSTDLSDLGIKATNKDVYLYVCSKEFEEEGKNISANLVIKAQAAKKIVGVIDYTATGASPALSITATDSTKKAIKDPVALWCDTVDGTYSDASSFNGTELAKYLEAGGTIYVKMKGVSSADGKPQFSSKAVKVKIAKQAKAPKIKIDVQKDAIALKNGYDFAKVLGGSVDAPELNGSEAWFTILPSLKTAKINTLAASIVSTADFKPLDKKDSAATNDNILNKVSYTKYAVKSLTFDDLLTKLSNPTGDFVLAVRKSATAKKPASDVAYITIYEQTNAPLVYTKYNVDKQFLVATASEFAKNGFTLGNIVNYPGASGTSGYDDTFTVIEQADADTNGGNYEYLVINRADEANIDWSTAGWKKLDPAKTKITNKLKSKYTTINGTTVKKVTASLKAKNNITVTSSTAKLSDSDLDGLANDTYLLIRRGGDKASGVRASKYVRLFVGQNGKTYSLYSEQSNGEEAFSYTAYFWKWTKGTSGYAWTKDDSLTAIAWGKNTTETVEFPSVENADFFEGTAAGDPLALTPGNTKATLDVSGKFTTASLTQNVEGHFAIAEYANVKVTTLFGTGTPGQAGFQQATTLENKTMGIIEAGKVSSYSNSAWTSGNTVAVYVGKEYELTLANPAADADILAKGYYIDTTAGAKLVSNANYTIPASGEVDPATGIPTKVKFTVDTASETEIKVQIAVQKMAISALTATGVQVGAADVAPTVTTTPASLPTGVTVVYESLDTTKATIVGNKIHAVADGTVKIKATLKYNDQEIPGISFTADVTVAAAANP